MAKKVKQEVSNATPRNNIFLGVKGEPDTTIHVGVNNNFLQAADTPVEPKEAVTNPALVINRLPHNVTISYEGKAMIVAPRERARIANLNKLGALPKGVTVVPQQLK